MAGEPRVYLLLKFCCRSFLSRYLQVHLSAKLQRFQDLKCSSWCGTPSSLSRKLSTSFIPCPVTGVCQLFVQSCRSRVDRVFSWFYFCHRRFPAIYSHHFVPNLTDCFILYLVPLNCVLWFPCIMFFLFPQHEKREDFLSPLSKVTNSGWLLLAIKNIILLSLFWILSFIPFKILL